MKLLLVVPLLLATTVFPTAAAGPECLMVYPWSELCQGDVEGFLHGMGIGVSIHCIAMSPWWEICNGDVAGVLRWVQDNVGPLP